MAELSPEFVTTANRMGVPLPPRHRPRFLSRWFRIDWTGALTAGWPLTAREQADAITYLAERHGIDVRSLMEAGKSFTVQSTSCLRGPFLTAEGLIAEPTEHPATSVTITST